MSWSWNPHEWRTSTKLLLGLATVWPIIYMALFFGLVITILTLTSAARGKGTHCGYLDSLAFDQKVRNGEIKELTVSGDQFVATTHSDGCVFEAWVRDESSRKQILSDARELVNNQPRVEKIEERPASREGEPFGPIQAAAPVGFMLLMIVHFATIVLMTAEMPFFILLAVKNDVLDQTWKVVWIVLLALGAILAAPVYWYQHVWRRPRPVVEREAPVTGEG